MGRIITPKYRVEMSGNFSRMGKLLTPQAWHGRVSKLRLENFRRAMNASFARGGHNFHVSETDGFIYHVSMCRIVRQSDGVVICESTAPMFEVV